MSHSAKKQNQLARVLIESGAAFQYFASPLGKRPTGKWFGSLQGSWGLNTVL
jgi:hypothetical protein